MDYPMGENPDLPPSLITELRNLTFARLWNKKIEWNWDVRVGLSTFPHQ